MEVAQRYSIAWKGLKNGRHDFRFEVDKALFEAFESTEIKDGRCEVSVGVDRSEKQLTLDVGITGHVVVECDRCLEDCRVPIDFEGQLVVKFSDEVHEYDGEVMWMLPGEDRVELAQYIYESIVLSLPYQRVHPEGECNPEMLERFRIVSDREFASIEAAAEGAGERGGGEWHILNTKSRRRDAISAEPTTRLPFRRWLPARTAAQRCSITVYAPSAASIAESSPSRRKLPNNSGAQKSASPRGVPLF